MYTYLNGSFVAEDKAVLQVNDLSIQRGYGIFDFFKTIDGKFIFLDDHLDRFYYSAERMRLPVGKTRQELVDILTELSIKNNLPDSGIKVTLTGGYSDDGYTLGSPNLIITQKNLTLNKSNTLPGLKLITWEHQRQMPDVKTIDYLMAIWLRPHILQQNADDVLYHTNGIVTECPRTNFFIVTKDNHVVTPAKKILKGITRKYVLQLAAEFYQVEERDISIEEVMNAKEAFIASTTKGITPISEVNANKIGNGNTGEITKTLQKHLQELVYS
ncbi:MAG: aminotransferase class IV [Chitinophagaceae bacterium]